MSEKSNIGQSDSSNIGSHEKDTSQTPQDIEIQESKPKYKKPYVMTPARIAAVERMKAGRKKNIELKKTNSESTVEKLQSQMMDLQKRIADMSKPTDQDEIKVSRPVKIEKESKKETSYQEFKTEMEQMKNMMQQVQGYISGQQGQQQQVPLAEKPISLTEKQVPKSKYGLIL